MSGFGYYIYYRVDEGRAAELESRVRALQSELEQRTRVAGRLMKKREDPLLWMEVYEGVHDPVMFERALSDLVVTHRLAQGLQAGSERKIECFRA